MKKAGSLFSESFGYRAPVRSDDEFPADPTDEESREHRNWVDRDGRSGGPLEDTTGIVDGDSDMCPS